MIMRYEAIALKQQKETIAPIYEIMGATQYLSMQINIHNFSNTL